MFVSFVDSILCVAPMNGRWHRAQIMSFMPDGVTAEIKLMDEGGYACIDTASLRQIREDFLYLPFQAAECYLANIAPSKCVASHLSACYVVVHCMVRHLIMHLHVASNL